VVLIGRRSLPVNVLPPTPGARLTWIDVTLNALMFALVVLGADALGVGAGAGAGSGLGGGVLSGFAMLGAGITIGVVYVRRQLALAVPLFPVDLLRIPVFRLSMCSSVGTFAAQMMAYISLPFLLLDAYGRSPAQTGLILIAWPLGVVAIAPVAGWLIGRIPDGLLGGIGLAMLSSGLALLAALPAQPSNADIVWRLALCGLGFGLFQSPNNHTIVTSAPAHRSGGASGMLGTARLTGQTLGAVLLATIFSFFDAHNGRGPFVALVLGACFAAIAAVTSSLRVKHAPALEEQPHRA
jgi:DHA2 family multidrug resistance protein-like MFS transporter